MKPFRKHLAIAVDGGGICGLIATRALTMLEDELGYPLSERIELAVGTSTGSIIAASLASGLDAKTINQLYMDLGDQVFHKSIRTYLWFLFNYRYSQRPLEKYLHQYLGDRLVVDLWRSKRPVDIVITTFDIVENRTRFIKPYKSNYADWHLVKAVLASAAAPTYFPSVDGQFIDGGVGSYNNPCYLAAYEIQYCLGWKPEETTLISIGAGRNPNTIKKGEADRFTPIQYVQPLLGAFIESATDQQVDLVSKLFTGLDFRRFQIDLSTVINLDDASQITALTNYGQELGLKLIRDGVDEHPMNIIPDDIPSLPKVSATTIALRRQTSKNDTRSGSQVHKSAKPARAPQKH